ncbi:MAG: hypothetical protein ACRDXX_15190 [Stackebrandtia sp.]
MPNRSSTTRHAYSRWRSLLRLRPLCRCGRGWPCAAKHRSQWPSDAAELADFLSASSATDLDEPARPKDLPRLMD